MGCNSSVCGATASLFPAAKHSSASQEWYSPPEIVVPGRELMGDIDLDPASSRLANEFIAASTFYDEASNGFVRQWHGRVWLNPPGGYCDKHGRTVIRASKGTAPCTTTGACGLDPGHEHHGVRSSAKAWWEKLCAEYASGRVTQAVFVGFNAEVLRSTQESQTPCMDFPFCIPSQRLRFLHATADEIVPGDAPPHMSVVVYLPENEIWYPSVRAAHVERMRQSFGQLGVCR